MEDPAELATVDDVLRERHRRDAAVVVPDGVRHARLLDGGAHLLTLGHVHRQRLLAEDRLAVLGRLDGDLGVQVVGGADVDGVDVIGGDELAPVGLDPLVAPAVGEGLSLLRIACRDRLQNRQVFQVEKVLDAVVAVGVGAAHEAVADHADAEGFCHGRGPSWWWCWWWRQGGDEPCGVVRFGDGRSLVAEAAEPARPNAPRASADPLTSPVIRSR